MKKKKLALTFISVILFLSMIPPAMGDVNDYIGIVSGNEFKYSYSLTNTSASGTVHVEFNFTLHIISVVKNNGPFYGATIDLENIGDDNASQSILDGFYMNYNFDMKQVHNESLLPDPTDPVDQQNFKYGAYQLIKLDPLWLITNTQRPLFYELALNERDGPCNITLNYEFRGVVDELTLVDENSGGSIEFSLIQNNNFLPGFSVPIFGFASLVSIVFIGFKVKKKKYLISDS